MWTSSKSSFHPQCDVVFVIGRGQFARSSVVFELFAFGDGASFRVYPFHDVFAGGQDVVEFLQLGDDSADEPFLNFES